MRANHLMEELNIQFEIEIKASPAKVWSKLATLEGLKEWFGRDLIFEHRVGGRFQLQGEQPGEGPYRFVGQVVKIDVEKELAFTWKSESESWPTHTLVSFRLEPTASGTRVTLTHSGFAALGAPLNKNAFEGHVQGWTMSKPLVDLKALVEGS